MANKRATPKLPPVVPQPRTASARPGSFRVRASIPIVLLGPYDDDATRAARALQLRIAQVTGLSLAVERHSRTEDLGAHIALRSEGDGEGYELQISDDGVRVEGHGPAGLRYGVETLGQLIAANGRFPCCRIEDAPDFRYRGVMLDVSRGKVPTVETIRTVIDRCAALKLNVLMLYTEHTFRFRRHPEIGRDDSPLDAQALQDLDRYAAEQHVELIPCLQSLGHMEHVLKLDRYRQLAETDLGWTVSPAEPGTYDLLGDLLDEYLPNFRSSFYNANCDEPWDLERGKSGPRAAELGPGGVYLEHVRRVRDLAAKHGRRTMIWGDVVHAHPERIPEIDRDFVLLDWWYEAEHVDFDRVKAFSDAKIEFWVCPGTSSWNSLFPRVENSRLNISRWADAGRRHGAAGLLNTDWGDFGHYNLLGNSWFAYAWGAQESWSGNCDAKAFDAAFSRRLFSDSSGEVARLYRALGDVHDPGFAIFNGSPLQYLFFDDVDRSYFSEAAKPGALRKCETKLIRIHERIARAREKFGSDEATWGELDYAASASLFAVRKTQCVLDYNQWRRQPDMLSATDRRRLAKRLRKLADEQRALSRTLKRLWLARSAISNFDQVAKRLAGSVRSLRAAASRLDKNRPGTPPPRHEGFKGADIIRILRGH